MYPSDRMKTLIRIMTRTSGLWTANCNFLNIYLRRKQILLLNFL